METLFQVFTELMIEIFIATSVVGACTIALCVFEVLANLLVRLYYFVLPAFSDLFSSALSRMHR